MIVYLILWCDCSDGGSLEKRVRAFSSVEARDAAFKNDYGRQPHLTGWERADVVIDGPELSTS